MPRTSLTNPQIVDLVDIIKESGSKQRKADVLEQAYMLLEDVPVSNTDETAALIWNVYKYGISKLPEVKKVKAGSKKTGTKVEIAREIMAEHYGKSTRKEIIEMMMDQAGLSKAGASTYHFNIKTEMDDSTK